ncbi:DUF5694 domain-containing protein [Pedobacter psychrophilus]|nr:DUF5694 domain-containing protein [Pedobacter psychrophilus]
MKLQLILPILLIGVWSKAHAQAQKTDIFILGSDHLAQIYKSDNPNTDVLLAKRQKEIADFSALVLPYKPDMIMVELLPEDQTKIDSLYGLFLQDKLKIEDLPDGRSEVYQLAFRMGKKLNLPKILCVNAPGATSQSILENGENIEIYKKENLELRTFASEKYKALQEGSLSFKDFLTFLNQPEIINKIYHLRYITPSRVINGTFKNPDAMVDTAFVNPKYIGAELTSVFKNRDYKIYSNIVTTVNQQNSKKTLLIIGVAHIGSLKNIIRDDEEFNLIDGHRYLDK